MSDLARNLSSKTSFTLIELLIVIGIVAVLAVAVVLVLNPAELLKQGRDANRLSDMDTLNRVVSLYLEDVGGSLGAAASTTYLSIPDPLATSTAGDQCQGLGLPSLPTGWSYHCAASSNLQNTDGTGWMPLNLKSQSFGASLGSLPKDPTNTTSSGFYYTYTPAGFTYALTATMESQKYLVKALNDGGYDPARYETGSNLALVAQWEGLVGWWTFDEGSGSTAKDSSGNGNTLTWLGNAPHYTSNAKVGLNAGYFDGSTNDMNVSNGGNQVLPTSNKPFSISLWLNTNNITGLSQNAEAIASNEIYNTSGFRFAISCPSCNFLFWSTESGGTFSAAGSTRVSINTWYLVTVVYDGTKAYLYVNGILEATSTGTYIGNTSTLINSIGGKSPWSGSIDDVRIYSRALSAADIQNMYNAEK